MISVVIPTLDADKTLPSCLAALVPAVVDGLVAEVVIADGGSTDQTLTIADDAGCEIVRCAKRGRGPQLREGAAAARKPWLLFLHADTVLQSDWQQDAATFMRAVDTGQRKPAAAAFRFGLDDQGLMPSLLSLGVQARSRFLKLPYGDQGLLLPKSLYNEVGGYPEIPLMEDVALIRAIPRSQRAILNSTAITSARRYRDDGYLRRVLTNWTCLSLYTVGVSPERINRIYRRGK